MQLTRTVKLVSAALLALGAHAAQANKAGNSLNIAFDAAPATLDAYKESDRPGLALARMVFSGLLQKNQDTGEFGPAIATGYKFVDDTTIELPIRKDVKFHDGTLLTIDDVLYTLNLVSSEGYKARFQNQVAWIAKVEKASDDTVRIKMKTPYPLALEMLSENLPIYPRKYYEANQSDMGAKPIGTGPYRLVESLPGSRYVYERYEDYFGPKPAVQKLVVRVLPDANTQYAELLSGGLDWIWRVPPDVAKRMEKQPTVTVKSSSIMRISYISLNPRFDDGKSPLARQEVRQAINHAIDREAIRKALVGGASKVIDAACNPAQFGCAADVQSYKFDPARAKQLLAQAGYPNGVTLDLVISAPPRAILDAAAAQMAQAGIKLNLVEQQYGTAMTNWREGKIAMLSSNWGSYGIADAALSTSNFFRGGPDDQARNPEVIKYLETADTSVDRELRAKNYGAAQKIVAEQAYWVPLWNHSLNAVQAKDLNFSVDGDEFPRFYKASWN
ncbi:ABC transporter substrate-binding protein [Achromobacter denitrificans]|uniref:ABC transporter substrate-binding protein n=1 Tax=Achromobacter denitrificans TaxID=32002 RepID=UPI000B48A890|nr:ABC transporter substrate-binding protein [Achromobacter denitrificans]